MDDLEALRAQFRALQQTSQQEQEQPMLLLLNERSAADLVAKLLSRGMLRLTFSPDGREFATPARLRADALRAIEARGRVPHAALGALLNVPAAAADAVAAELCRGAAVRSAGADLLSAAFLRRVSAEVSEALAASPRGALRASDVAARFDIGADVLLQCCCSVGGVRVEGTGDAALLYTDAFVEWHRARARGALCAATVPTKLAPLLLAQTQQQQQSASEALFAAAVADLVRSGRLAGSLEENRTLYVPAVYSRARRQFVEAFYAANGFVEFRVLDALRLPRVLDQALALDTLLLAPRFVDVVRGAVAAAAEEEGGGTVDVAELLPPALSAADVAAVLRMCLAKHGQDVDVVDNGRFVVSRKLLTRASARLGEVVPRLLASCNGEEGDDGGDEEAAAALSVDGEEERRGGKKKTRKQPQQTRKSGKKAGPGRGKKQPSSARENLSETLAKLVREWFPEDVVCDELVPHIAKTMREAAERLCAEARETAAQEKAVRAKEKAQQLSDVVNAAFFDAWLARSAAEDVPAGPDRQTLDRHLQKTVYGELLLELARAQTVTLGIALPESAPTAADAAQAAAKLITALPEAKARDLRKLQSSLAAENVSEFLDVSMDVCKNVGIKLRKIERGAMRERLLQHQAALEARLAQETRPPAALHTALVLLNVTSRGKYLPAPPKCVHVLIALLEGHVPEDTIKTLREYQQCVVAFLRGKAELEAQLLADIGALKKLANK